MALALSASVAVALSGCGSAPDEAADRRGPERPASGAASPPIVDFPAPEDPEASQKPSPTIDALLRDNFTIVLPLPKERGYYENLLPSGPDEVLLFARTHEPETARLIRTNVRTGQSSVVWEQSDSAYVSAHSLRMIEEGIFEWDLYERSTRRVYRLTGDKVEEVAEPGIDSPDGRWAALSGWDRQGIWGVDYTTGERVQWTTGAEDAQPLWLPDSSGFVFLRDTGEQIGDGAGPYYELARFDVASGETSVYPFEKGYWGFIEWLEPGATLVAHHGFDDMVAAKVVQLGTGSERELIDTADLVYVNIVVEPNSRRVLISDQGRFAFYGSDGELESEVPWPTGFDTYTNRATIAPDHPEGRKPYYEGGMAGAGFGPSRMQFSPDGTRIAYLLGAIGESVDDVVEGTRIALADRDGRRTTLLTQDYLRIGEYRWAADGNRLIALFTLPSNRKQAYVGIIDL